MNAPPRGECDPPQGHIAWTEYKRQKKNRLLLSLAASLHGCLLPYASAASLLCHALDPALSLGVSQLGTETSTNVNQNKPSLL